MICKYVQYRIKEKEDLEIVKKAISDFVAAIRTDEANTFYEAYQCEDEVSFIHFMKFLNQDEEERHRKAPYTAKFVEVLYPRCVEPPKFTDIQQL